MTDHAKALRYIAALVDSPPSAAAMCHEAADEIDRLRAEVAGKDAEIAALRDEVAQLCGYDNAKEMDAHCAADANRAILTEAK